MDETTTDRSDPVRIEWQRGLPEKSPSPIVCQVPYLELKLEHPDLEAMGHGDRFFPDAVPYDLNGTSRVFYWRPAVAPSSDEPECWTLTCATTHNLTGIRELPSPGPSLVTEGSSGTIVVVDGTVGGDATTSHITSYTPPDVTLDGRSDSDIELTVDGNEYVVPTGERRRITLPEQRVVPLSGDAGATTVAPELVVRYPGKRELHHPATGATYRLFPSFGLDFDSVPNPLPVPTTTDELDDAALARDLGVNLSQRPYPERVLWQAFAYSAFDPHGNATPELTQLETGHIVLESEGFRGD